MGPKRDCFGQYCEALRAEGLKTIATFHHIRTFNWYLPDVLSRPPETAPPVALDQGEPLKLHVFIDKSVVEVFANGKQCVALRVYPGRKDSVGVSLRAQGQDAQLRSLDA